DAPVRGGGGAGARAGGARPVMSWEPDVDELGATRLGGRSRGVRRRRRRGAVLYRVQHPILPAGDCDMAYQPISLDHVNIYVRNAERSHRWYTDILGLHTQDIFHFPGTDRMRAAFLAC